MTAASIEACIIARLSGAADTLAAMSVHGLGTGTLLQMEQALGAAGGSIAVLPKSSPGMNLNHGKASAGATWEVIITMNPNTPPMHIVDAAQAAQAALFGFTPADAAGVHLTGAPLTVGDAEYHLLQKEDKTPVSTARFPVSVQYARHA